MRCDIIAHVRSTDDGAHEGRLAARSDDLDERREVHAFDVERRHGEKVAITGPRVNRQSVCEALRAREAFGPHVFVSLRSRTRREE